jgi:hypothetical protein
VNNTPVTRDALPSIVALHAAFLSVLPRIELHGRVAFRHLRCQQAKDDAVAETVALCWRAFVRLVEKGKDPLTFVSRIADFAARHVRSCRRLCGRERGQDVLSPRARQRHGFRVESLPSSPGTRHEERYAVVRGQHRQDAFEERLRDNTQTPVPEQVCFRLDFPAWLQTLAPWERDMIGEMANNERTLDLSQRLGLSPARVSQLRRELHGRWTRFCGGGR